MLDLTKPVQTRNGRPVTLLTTNAKNDRPIVGLVEGPHEAFLTGTSYEGQEPHSWYSDGSHSRKGGVPKESHLDLVNVAEYRWVNIYNNVGDGSKSKALNINELYTGHYSYTTEEEACGEALHSDNYVGTIKVMRDDNEWSLCK